MGGKSSEKKVHDKENREKKKERRKDYNDSDVTENNLNNLKKKKKNKKKLEKDCTDSDVNEDVECLKENKEVKVDNKKKKKKKKKKKQKMREVDAGVETDSVVDVDGIGSKSLDENVNSEVQLRKKEKKRKKNGNVDSESQFAESMAKKQVNDDRVKMVKGTDGGENAGNVEGEKKEVDQECENGSLKDSKKRKRGKDSSDEVRTEKKSSKLVNGEGEFPVKDRKKKKKSNSSVQLEASSREITKDGKDGDSRNLDGGNKVEKKKGTKANKSSEGNNTKAAQESGKGVDGTDPLENSTRKKKSKSVSFSEDVEIFPPEDMGTTPTSSKRKHRKETLEEGGLIWGKRFSKEEDEMLREAVNDYIIRHDLDDDEDAIEKIMNCRKYPEVRKCWREIGAALPWRPMQAVYYRAHILYQRADTRAWTQEELDEVRKFHQKYGSDWKTLAEKLGKHRFHVKDAWRRVKLENSKKGHWSQDEYQTLFDLVNQDLRMRTLAERKTKHGMLRDNICWTAISEKLETRHDALCCVKWYKQLTSPMVAQGEWLDTDDYRLLIALYELDACCMEDVDWDCLLEHRSGDVCRKRWNEMVKHLGSLGNKSFADLVDVLLDRYCPDVLEAREIYDSKTPVDE